MSLAKYPTDQIRFPREKFAQSLTKMCEKLDAQSHKDIPWKNTFIRQSGVANCYVEKVWVFGSFARGAVTCGDLDVIVQVDSESSKHLHGTAISKAFFGSPPYVRTYKGDPDENTSGVQLGESVLIWDRSGKDWRSALQGIKVDLLATRFDRPVDVIPFRPEQIGVPMDDPEHALFRDYDADIVAWRFEPLIEPSGVTFNTWQAKRLHMSVYELSAGDKAILPYVFEWLVRSDGEISPITEAYGSFCVGRTIVVCGHSRVRHSWLNDLRFDRILIAPHLNTRGPNGFLIIERGTNHPLVELVKDVECAVLVDGAGNPVKSPEFLVDYSTDVCTVELLSKQEFDALLVTDPQQTEYKIVRGNDLLQTLAGCYTLKIAKRFFKIPCEHNVSLEILKIIGGARVGSKFLKQYPDAEVKRMRNSDRLPSDWGDYATYLRGIAQPMEECIFERISQRF